MFSSLPTKKKSSWVYAHFLYRTKCLQMQSFDVFETFFSLISLVRLSYICTLKIYNDSSVLALLNFKNEKQEIVGRYEKCKIPWKSITHTHKDIYEEEQRIINNCEFSSFSFLLIFKKSLCVFVKLLNLWCCCRLKQKLLRIIIIVLLLYKEDAKKTGFQLLT